MSVYIQWHNCESLCMDFDCPACGAEHHHDGPISGTVRCGNCGEAVTLNGVISTRLATIKEAAIATTLVVDEGDE